ncbi:hypothetical protein VTP01DRAFT_2153 [Rhizomucor pusillus]|uniref:uncharacterized protein n=1 Tax=Rhizomucor pusillus TaxID=4840 RepID=UPI00374352F8
MESLEQENRRLRDRIAELEQQLGSSKPQTTTTFEKAERLSNAEIRRYGRQLILPGFGIPAQLKLRNSSVLIVGAGGLGSPAALYLGAGGVGRLGIVDHDTVDVSNLHRQVIHKEKTQGISKAVSAMMAVNDINPMCRVVPYETVLDSSNALDVIKDYDVVLDATDNVATRYLLNDACVLLGKPLVSGSALRMDGQLTVYNYNGGPCYRCLHPVPPPPETVTNCSDGGVLGVVPGIIGTLQALEAIKIITGIEANVSPSFLIFSGSHSPMFRTMKLRGKKKDCAICGENPTIKQLVDYVQFCGAAATDKEQSLSVLSPEERVHVQEYYNATLANEPHVLLDVRSKVQFEICSLPNSIHIPLAELEKRIPEIDDKLKETGAKQVYVVCRLGNDSQLAVQILQKHGIENARDIAGGLYKWATEIDDTFPIY